MNADELTLIQNQIFTKLVIDLLKEQRTNGIGVNDYLLDKYEVDQLVKEKLKEYLAG